MKVDFSRLFNLNVTDLLKGLLMAIIGAALTTIYTAVDAGSIDWSAVWKISLSTGISYLLKNFFSPAPNTVVIDSKKTDVEYK